MLIFYAFKWYIVKDVLYIIVYDTIFSHYSIYDTILLQCIWYYIISHYVTSCDTGIIHYSIVYDIMENMCFFSYGIFSTLYFTYSTYYLLDIIYCIFSIKYLYIVVLFICVVSYIMHFIFDIIYSKLYTIYYSWFFYMFCII